MCCWTPPGTSHEYGHTMPIRTSVHSPVPISRSCAGHRRRVASPVGVAVTGSVAVAVARSVATAVAVAVAGTAAGQARGVEVVHEQLLQHVPVFRVLTDRLLEDGGQGLRHLGDLRLAGPGGGDGDLVVDMRGPLGLADEPAADRHQSRAS